MTYSQWEKWVLSHGVLPELGLIQKATGVKFKFVRRKSKTGSPVWKIEAEKAPPPLNPVLPQETLPVVMTVYPKYWLTADGKLACANSEVDLGQWWTPGMDVWTLSTSNPPMEEWATRQGLKQ